MSKAVANLTQLNETITFSAQDNGETISVNITEAARGPAGAAGAAGPNSVTSATTSDGTANLSISNVTTATAEVTGTLIANHIHGNLAGSVYAHVRAGEALAKGDPVYVSGSHGTGTNLIAIVSKADASDETKMPAVGVMDAAVAHNATGHMVITGTVSDINTAAYPVNAELYVAEGGGFNASPSSARAQPIARVERSNTNNGAVIVKVNGLSATDATISTLVRRDSTGSASFFSSNHLSSISIGSNSLTATPITGGALFFNDTSQYAAALYSVTTTDNRYVGLPDADGYVALTDNTNGVVDLLHGGTGGTTAGTARTNLGLGTADTPTFSNLTLNTGTITVPQPLSFSQTWNAAAMTFSAFQMNVTDTASASGSLLMDLRVSGGTPVSKFSVKKNGVLTLNNSGTITWTSADDLTFSSGLAYQRVRSYSFWASNLFAGIGDNGTAASAAVHLANSQFVGWTSGSVINLGTYDTFIGRDNAANTLAQRNGTNAQVTRVYDTYTSATDYHRLAIATARATATAMSGATVTLTNIIPAGAVVVGVTCKVTTAITGATSFDIGTATDVDRFGAAIAVALGTTSDNRNWTAGTIECFPTATSLILTANGSNFTAGAVYVSVQYLSGQAD